MYNLLMASLLLMFSLFQFSVHALRQALQLVSVIMIVNAISQ